MNDQSTHYQDNHPAIYYYCPETKLQSAGIRRIYRHVELLGLNGFDAYILHCQKGFRRSDMPPAPVRYLGQDRLQSNATVVIPEGFPNIMHALQNQSVRRFAIVLNWDYVFKNLPEEKNYGSYGIERVLVISPAIGRMISWSMGLPVNVIRSGINHSLYRYSPECKRPQISFIKRKGIFVDQLKRMLAAHNVDFIKKIRWVGLEGLTEAQYADEICRSAVFLNASLAEGYPTSCLEAMAAGTVVASYDSLGSRDILLGQGPQQNCLLAPNGDYLSMAYSLAPVLKDLINGKMNRWASIMNNGIKTASGVTPEKEEHSLVSFWREAYSCN